jgi:hypothetical protein
VVPIDDVADLVDAKPKVADGNVELVVGGASVPPPDVEPSDRGGTCGS